MKEVEIDVTSEVIAESIDLIRTKRRSRSISCPVALAARRAGLLDAGVDMQGIYIFIAGYRLKNIPIPYEAKSFIHAFDGDETSVQPIKFTVQVPEEWLEQCKP